MSETAELMVLPGSQFSMKGMAAVMHKGLDLKLRIIPFLRLKRDVPGGKVPVMIWRGETVLDSTDIMKRLDRDLPENPFFPKDVPFAAEVAEIEEFVDTKLNRFAVYFRWVDDEGFKNGVGKSFKGMPFLLRWFLPGIVRGSIKKRAGKFGRMSIAEVLAEVPGDFMPLEERLQKTAFLHGDTPYASDFALYGILYSTVGPYSPGRPGFLEEFQFHGLIAWLERMKELYPIRFP